MCFTPERPPTHPPDDRLVVDYCCTAAADASYPQPRYRRELKTEKIILRSTMKTGSGRHVRGRRPDGTLLSYVFCRYLIVSSFRWRTAVDSAHRALTRALRRVKL
ncbi:unnamed protein product [Macrosiphum euphorbiae]|uniref:Uncharacterized protein n=1 Tax=Macrosiphum euphorbiae TaxID=13131 RepID=A0AAV0VJE4_9HEMI|nr:unnamed protein product [Macrosiphum euphorbiae]